MTILGAHMSIAGGYFRAVDAAEAHGCDCVQLFTKNNNQWAARPIVDQDVTLFRQSLENSGIKHSLSHASYLINLASPDRGLWKKSIDAMVIELARADQLGIPYVVVHPGSYTSSSEQAGIKRIGKALDEIHRQAKTLSARCLLETTAGQGTNLGWNFEQLAGMLEATRNPDQVGICLDTCHVFAAGYAMQTEKQYLAMWRKFQRTVGLRKLKAFHLNDSKRACGSRVDRHENIGLGEMGLEPFRHLVNDKRFQDRPMYLETPKGTFRRRPWDKINLATLRGLKEASTPAGN
jgi:deoxyribonuclease-4